MHSLFHWTNVCWRHRGRDGRNDVLEPAMGILNIRDNVLEKWIIERRSCATAFVHFNSSSSGAWWQGVAAGMNLPLFLTRHAYLLVLLVVNMPPAQVIPSCFPFPTFYCSFTQQPSQLTFPGANLQRALPPWDPLPQTTQVGFPGAFFNLFQGMDDRQAGSLTFSTWL